MFKYAFEENVLEQASAGMFPGLDNRSNIHKMCECIAARCQRSSTTHIRRNSIII